MLFKKCSHQFSHSFPKFYLELNFLPSVILRKNITGHFNKDLDVSSSPRDWARTSALGSYASQFAGCAPSSGCSTQQPSEHDCVSIGRDFFVFFFRVITLSRIATCSEQSPFLGLKEGERRRKRLFCGKHSYGFLLLKRVSHEHLFLFT